MLLFRNLKLGRRLRHPTGKKKVEGQGNSLVTCDLRIIYSFTETMHPVAT